MEIEEICISFPSLWTTEKILEEIKTKLEQKNPKSTIVKVRVDFDMSQETDYKKIINLSKEIKSIGFDSCMSIDAKTSSLTNDEINKLIDLEEDLGKNNSILTINGGIYQEYSLMDLLLADEKIKIFVEDLKSKELSPFENYLVIYDFLTRKLYNENEQNLHKSRDIISVMNGNNIVCVGYAAVMERLCSELGIRCATQGSTVYDNSDKYKGEHETNFVYIKDEKYGIDGWFYSDACWDSIHNSEDTKRTYNYCLIPLTDKDEMKNKKIKYKNESGDYFFFNKFGGLFSSEEKKQIEEKCNNDAIDLIYDDKARENAYSKLEELLKQHKIPKDIYQQCKGKNVPYACELHNLLANMFLHNDDVVEDLIEQLNSIINNSSDNEVSAFNSSISCDSKITDIYETLNQEKSRINGITNKYIGNEEDIASYKNLCNNLRNCKQFEEIIQIKKQQKQLPVKVEKVYGKIEKNEIKIHFSECSGKISQLLQNKFYKDKQQLIHDSSKPIPLKTFETALKISYAAQGIPQNLLDEKVEDTIIRCILNSEQIYLPSAQNCFRTEAKELEEFETPHH